MNKRVTEIASLPAPDLDLVTRTGSNISFAVLKDVNAYPHYFYHKSCLERALDYYPDSWRLTYQATGVDAKEAVALFPAIMKMCNKNRRLRAQNFSGVRMCNLATRPAKKGEPMCTHWHYRSDIVLSDSYTTALFAHRLAASSKRFSSRWNVIRVFTERDIRKTSRQILQHACDVEKRIRAGFAGAFIRGTEPVTRVVRDSEIEIHVRGEQHTELVYALRVLLETVRKKCEWIELAGNPAVSICCDKEFEDEEYNEPFVDRFFRPIRYKHFQAFGSAYNNPNIL